MTKPRTNGSVREFRYCDPTRDTPQQLAVLNDWDPATQAWWQGELERRLWVPRNLLLAIGDGEPVGMAAIFDGGLPFIVIEGVYLKPDYRSFDNALRFMRVIDAEMQSRGVSLYLSHTPPKLGRVMQRYGWTRVNETDHLLLGKVPGRR